MPKIILNDKEYQVQEGLTIIQVADQLGIEIPRFCYHEALAVAGNCRMCLVEVDKIPKPVASCVQNVSEGMKIYTDSPMARKAREGVMEFLLINHPLDCPICDQGGECDLQDQAMKYGKGASRYHEEKRIVENKELGPLVSTFMTRCIHCMRCVRFLEDIAGTRDLGAFGRGEHMEINTFAIEDGISQGVTSELSGNIVDLCPVGALTAKPSAYKARRWELRNVYSIDILDAMGSNIRVDYRGNEVIRVMPRTHHEINEEWLSDKARFAYDALKYQRLTEPRARQNGLSEILSWERALQELTEKLLNSEPGKIGALAGQLADAETLYLAKQLLELLGSQHYDCRRPHSVLDSSKTGGYLFNSGIKNIEKADLCLIIGSNPRHEAPLLNSRLRRGVVYRDMVVANIGKEFDLSYSYKQLGEDWRVLKAIAEGKHHFCDALAKSKYPMLIVSESNLYGPLGKYIQHYTAEIAEKYSMLREEWCGYNVLSDSVGLLNGLSQGFVGKLENNSEDIATKSEILLLFGQSNIDPRVIPATSFVVYFGHHDNELARRANLVLPVPSYLEKTVSYMNIEGRMQRTQKAVQAPGLAREEWRILLDIARGVLEAQKEHAIDSPAMEILAKLLVNNIVDIEILWNLLSEISPLFKHEYVGQINEKMQWKAANKSKFLVDTQKVAAAEIKDYNSFVYAISDYYRSDELSQNSRTMALCSQFFNKK